MLVEKLRAIADQCSAAADHLEFHGAEEVGASAFNWKALFDLVVSILPLIPSLFQQPTPPVVPPKA